MAEKLLTARTGEMAKALGVSTVHLGRLAKDGSIPKPVGRGTWDVVAVVRAYLTFQADQFDRRLEVTGVKAEELALARARREKTEAERDAQAMKNAELRRELLPRAEVTAAVQAAFGRCRARLLAIPTKGAAVLAPLTAPGPIKAKLTGMIHEALAELSATKVDAKPGSDHDRGRANGRGGNGMVGGAHASADAHGQ